MLKDNVINHLINVNNLIQDEYNNINGAWYTEEEYNEIMTYFSLIMNTSSSLLMYATDQCNKDNVKSNFMCRFQNI